MRNSHYGVQSPNIGPVVAALVRKLRALPHDLIGPMPTTRTTMASVWKEAEGWTPPTTDHANKAIEDVRDYARLQNDGLAYLGLEVLPKGHPHVGMIFLAEWISRDQKQLLNDGAPPIALPITLADVNWAAVNALERRPFMALRASPDTAITGFACERSVSEEMKRLYPKIWLPATNDGDPTRGAGDDFRMNIGGKTIQFDVATLSASGLWSCRSKRPTDVHVLTERVAENGQFVYGYCDGARFGSGLIAPGCELPWERLFVRLNCLKRGIDYALMRRIVVERIIPKRAERKTTTSRDRSTMALAFD